MSVPQGKAAYKKKDGIITLSEDQRTVIWTPLPGTGPPVISLNVANITNLQQTPDSSAKVMLKIFEKPPSSEGDAVAFLFHFTSPTDARAEANAVKDLLSRLLVEIRGSDPRLPKPAATPAAASPAAAGNVNGSGSAAMSFASAVNSRPAAARWFDDSQLRSDIELQQSLMKRDRNLHQTYMDARQTKPDSISDAAFNSQFWSTRTSLLRAHAIEMNQKKGAYNVLSAVKPKTVDGELKLNISVEQVQMIFAQHPLVKRLYNENVPKLSEGEFWSRFFLSKLSKRLRGERVNDNDNTDQLFDKFSEADDTVQATRILSLNVPHIIDLEGNEENQGGYKSGNRKDVEMRPRSNVPIVKTLNSLSERIMANVAPSDQDAANPSGLDDETYSELALRDLRGDLEESRIILNVKEQSRFFSNQDSGASADAKVYESQVPSEVLFDVQADLDTLEEDGAGGIDLHTGIGVDEDSDSDDETPRQAHVGSRASRRGAQSRILCGLAQRRAEAFGQESDETKPMGLPQEIAQKAFLTNATTVEFLKQFWTTFLSGDPDRAQELAYHVESLKKSLMRIDAVAEEAEAAREQLIKQRREEIRVYYERTKNRIKWRSDMARGGKKAVLTLLGPTIKALQNAHVEAIGCKSRKALWMHAVRARALHAVPVTFRTRARHFVKSGTSVSIPQSRPHSRSLASTPACCRSAPDEGDEPKKDNEHRPRTRQPEQSARTGKTAGDSEADGKAADSPTTSTPAAEGLKEAFAGLPGRGRNGRKRAEDGMPPVNLPRWFLSESVSLNDRDTPSEHDPHFSDRIDLTTISSEARDTLYDYYMSLLREVSWTEDSVVDAVSRLRNGDIDPVEASIELVPWYMAHILAVLACGQNGYLQSATNLHQLLRKHIADLPKILAPNRPHRPCEQLVHSKASVSFASGTLSPWLTGRNGDKGDALMRRELVATLRAELRAVPSKHRLSEKAKRPVSVLTVTNFQGRKVAVSVLDDVAKVLEADIVHLSAPSLAEIVGGYLGQTPYTGRGDITMLGYAAAAINSRMPPRYQEKKDEDVEIPELFSQGSARVIKLPGLGRLANKLYQNAESDDRWDDLKTQHVLDELTRAADIKRPEQNAPRGSRLIVHLSEFVELNMTGEGVMLLNKLRVVIDRMWQKGTEVILVGSTSSNLAKSTELRDKIEEMSKDEYHFIPFHQSLPESTQKEWEQEDIASENLSNIRVMLSAMAGKPIRLPDVATNDSPGNKEVQQFRDYLSVAVYDINWVYRFATKILAFAGSSLEALHQGTVLEAFHIMKNQDKFWDQLHGAEGPYFSPLASSPKLSASGNAIAGGASKVPYRGELNEFEKKFLPSLVNQKEIKTTFDDVICPQDTKETLIALTSLSLTHPAAFLYGVLATERIPGCLLYGPPGTGKTLMAKAIARHSGASMLEVSAASINDKWVGNSEKNVRALFSLARKLSSTGSPVVLFLDEADALLGSRSSARSRSGGHRETLNQFLREWDGLTDANKAFVIVATNRPFDLDDAVLRRLPQRVLFDLPLRDGRLAILRSLLRDETLDAATVSLDALAAATELYSGSDLKNVCVAAAMEAVKEEVRAAKRHNDDDDDDAAAAAGPYVFPERRVLRGSHFGKALRDIGASISEDMPSLQAIRKFDERYGSARSKKRRRMGFEVMGDSSPRSDEALVRQPGGV
ncbi:uncharacterized protein E0L32_006428 [Thyridium curvatum]|uniref:BSD domain-containing protein n=1 Tax=Thyridium curvatum TaxID=1093900 RepID=A0A507B8X2_9PEZI|nr:uncharacterized protein E0L32_006428 [Thyridium curvatum]TPX13228.1 hypothetical protein E0L32_006428 [Thyridium curvatum]